MTDTLSESLPPQDAVLPAVSAPLVNAEAPQAEKVVPVSESIRYRRRAQQAEKRATQLEQQLQETQAKFESQLEELASAEAQRDELADQLTRTRHQRRLERTLEEFGVLDTEAAILLLDKESKLSPDADDSAIQTAVEGLLSSKPYLCGPGASPLPGATAASRGRASARSQLAGAAQRAIQSGDRRDIARYLRLRRQMATR